MRDYYVEAWVYSHLTTCGAEYFFVSGSIKAEPEDYSGVFSVENEECKGFIIELAAGPCRVDPAPYVFFPLPRWNNSTPKVHLRDDELRAMGAEIMVR